MRESPDTTSKPEGKALRTSGESSLAGPDDGAESDLVLWLQVHSAR